MEAKEREEAILDLRDELVKDFGISEEEAAAQAREVYSNEESE